ncbi:hypothetical protein ABDJ25_04630 [Streptomyces actinocidus]
MEYQRARDLTARRRAVKLPVKNYLPPLLAALDRPDRGLRGILVAGTNGKGSTCAFAVSGLPRWDCASAVCRVRRSRRPPSASA